MDTTQIETGTVTCETCSRPRLRSTSNANRGELRTCTFCRQEKWRNGNRDRISKANKEHYEANRAHHIQKAADWRAKNLERHQASMRRRKLKTLCSTPEYYDAKFTEQNGVCALCGKPTYRRLDQDHDHKRKIPRGLLCGPCNRRVGWFEAIRPMIPKIGKYLLQYENLSD